jgi:hypothetical protein
MPEHLEDILRRVASGELSPEEAEPLITATMREGPPETGWRPQQPRRPERPTMPSPPAPPAPPPPPGASGDGFPLGEPARRIVRLQVIEGGRPVVNLRIPMSWASLAGTVLPGLSSENAARLREAIRSGTIGRILEVQDEDGDGVIISTE